MSKKWDIRFLRLAAEVSSWSKDPSTKTGAVIARPDKSIVSVGYNGFPRGVVDTSEYYENREEKYKRIIHCEINAIIQAETSVEGCILYEWPGMSCERCAVQVIQSGISTVVCPIATEDFASRWADSWKIAEELFVEADIVVRKYPIEEIQ